MMIAAKPLSRIEFMRTTTPRRQANCSSTYRQPTPAIAPLPFATTMAGASRELRDLLTKSQLSCLLMRRTNERQLPHRIVASDLTTSTKVETFMSRQSSAQLQKLKTELQEAEPFSKSVDQHSRNGCNSDEPAVTRAERRFPIRSRLLVQNWLRPASQGPISRGSPLCYTGDPGRPVTKFFGAKLHA